MNVSFKTNGDQSGAETLKRTVLRHTLNITKDLRHTPNVTKDLRQTLNVTKGLK